MAPDQTQVSAVLDRMGSGDAAAASELLPLVYAELRGLAGQMMARERGDHTLQATALVHEAYARLVGSGEAGWSNRRHFFHAAAMAMRRHLVDHARGKGAVKRGGEVDVFSIDDVEVPARVRFTPDQLADVDQLLTDLAVHNARWTEVVSLRLFLGMTIAQVAELLGIAPSTVKADYSFALAWLRLRLEGAR